MLLSIRQKVRKKKRVQSSSGIKGLIITEKHDVLKSPSVFFTFRKIKYITSVHNVKGHSEGVGDRSR